MNDERPHSRACGVRRHEHGGDCHPNCPTCGGKFYVEGGDCHPNCPTCGGKSVPVVGDDGEVKFYVEGQMMTLTGNPAPLVPVLRQRAEDHRDVTVHLVDRSTIRGMIESVSDDDTTAVIVAGRDEFRFDTSAVVVVQTARTTREQLDAQLAYQEKEA